MRGVRGGGAIWYFDGSGRGGCCLGSVAVVLSHRRLDVGLFDVGEWDTAIPMKFSLARNQRACPSQKFTGQKYIYTGSSDSSVYIYDLVSGAQVARLEYHDAPVRDCSWHPFYPMIISSSWDGDIAKWEFPGSDKPTAF
uniref:Uncharacterized protein n=1 Tax=Fagus sylvatica TaxID=28930 RepID=A0A2N9HIF3_FAGSY